VAAAHWRALKVVVNSNSLFSPQNVYSVNGVVG
jgi:hypothetical protein